MTSDEVKCYSGVVKAHVLIQFEGTPDYDGIGAEKLKEIIAGRIRETIRSNLKMFNDVNDVGMMVQVEKMEKWGTLADLQQKIIKKFEKDASKLTIGTINKKEV